MVWTRRAAVAALAIRRAAFSTSPPIRKMYKRGVKSVMTDSEIPRMNEKFQKKFNQMLRAKFGCNILEETNVKVLIKEMPGWKWSRKLDPKRNRMLKQIFLDNIRSILDSGELNPTDEAVLSNLTITKVEFTGEFSIMKLHWLASGRAEDEETETALDEVADPLRSALSQLRLVGVVPRIVFLRDFSECRWTELSRLISEADMGPDHVPSINSVPPEMLSELSLEEQQPESSVAQSPASKTTNLFGLDRSAMLSRVRKLNTTNAKNVASGDFAKFLRKRNKPSRVFTNDASYED